MLSVEKFKQYFWNISEIFLSEYTYDEYIFPTPQKISWVSMREQIMLELLEAEYLQTT